MTMKTTAKKKTAGVAVVGILLAGGVWFGISGAQGEPPAPGPESGTNSNGQTYGSAEGVNSDAELPDLIAVYATNGRLGYLKQADYLPPQRSLDDVLRLPERAGELRAPGRTVPVYAEDGKTVIGEFRFS
ncbi:MAG: hypothetical protein QM662_06785 [Gordonia sp. (in: high G+C Gram-positive bacteria)]